MIKIAGIISVEGSELVMTAAERLIDKGRKKIGVFIAYVTVSLLILTGCNNSEEHNAPPEVLESLQDELQHEEKQVKLEIEEEKYAVNKEGATIEKRYPEPKGYTRTKVKENSFGEFLRNQKLKPYGEKAFYYNGREKNSNGVYDSAFDVDIGDRDLHQCADAIMLLRGEYLYSQGRYDAISFDFVSGFKSEYKKWADGYRIKVDGNNVSYYKAADPSDSYESFRKYMNMVMAYASTLSLEKELEPIDIENMEIGDVFIVGGSPGHAIIIVDMAINNADEKIFLLAQSYMPAQQTQVLINPMDKNISPWYSLKGKEKLITPEWNFELDKLKRF